MKNMGLTHLQIVAPTGSLGAEASARASGASDVLAAAEVYDTLGGALEGLDWVIGTSARLRELGPPVQDPREAAAELAERVRQNQTVSLVFGREKSGLSNEELDCCHRVVRIPAAPGYSSLNMAQAVQVLAYESFRAIGWEGGPSRSVPLAKGKEVADLLAHWERVVCTIGFVNPQSPQRTYRRLRRLFLRARPSEGEVRFLRGFLSAVEKRIHGGKRRYGSRDSGIENDSGHSS